MMTPIKSIIVDCCVELWFVIALCCVWYLFLYCCVTELADVSRQCSCSV